MENQPALIEVPTNLDPAIPPGFYKNKPRPNYFSPEVTTILVDRLLPQAMEWGKFPEHAAPEIAEQIRESLKNGTDGYQRAKYLEYHFVWYSDTALVEIMENDDLYGALKTAIKAWINDNNIVPAFQVGQEVSVKNVSKKDSILTGTITAVTDNGMYLIRISSKGHVELLFPWEDVEAWNVALLAIDSNHRE